MGLYGLLATYKKRDRKYRLYLPTSTERGEAQLLHEINTKFEVFAQPQTVSIGTFTFENIIGINKVVTNDRVKADLALVSYDPKTETLRNVCFISHKMGQKATDFQQYSGITTTADGSKRGAFSAHKEVLSFIADVKTHHRDDIARNRLRFYRLIEDATLIGRAVFGPEYGSLRGSNNVHAIGQGDSIFTEYQSRIDLRFTTLMVINSNVRPFMLDNSYRAVLGVTYRAAYPDHLRFSITPLSGLGYGAIKI